MTGNIWPKQVLERMPPRRRKRGRSKVFLMKGIHNAVAEKGLEEGQ
jgi:hypothetical protein